MPSTATVFRWLAGRPDFRERYAHAREAQADALADDILAIADDDGDPKDKRVRIDARKWLAGKLKPAVYGDRLELGGEVKHVHEHWLDELE